MKIGKKLKRQRELKKLTQDNVAKNLHVSRKTISGWETSRNLPDFTTLEKLCDLYNCSIDKILYTKPKKKIKHQNYKYKTIILFLLVLNLLSQNSFVLIKSLLILIFIFYKKNKYVCVGSTLLVSLLIIEPKLAPYFQTLELIFLFYKCTTLDY